MRLSFGVAPFFGSTIGSPVAYGSTRRSLVGSEILANVFSIVSRARCSAKRCSAEPGPIYPRPWVPAQQRSTPRIALRAALRPGHETLNIQLRHVEPAPLRPALESELCQLHALRTLGEIMLP